MDLFLSFHIISFKFSTDVLGKITSVATTLKGSFPVQILCFCSRSFFSYVSWLAPSQFSACSWQPITQKIIHLPLLENNVINSWDCHCFLLKILPVFCCSLSFISHQILSHIYISFSYSGNGTSTQFLRWLPKCFPCLKFHTLKSIL